MGSGVDHYEQCPVCAALGRDTRKDNLVVYRDGGKHCFACRYHSPGTKLLTEEPKKVNGASNLLPFDFTREVPPDGWKWLYQYGLSYQYWKEFIGYSPYHERIVFPVGDPVQFSLGRYLGKIPDSKKWWAWGNCHKHAEVIDNGDIKKLVIVEDLISAHKVGQVASSMPLFGTEIHDVHKYVLQSSDRPLVLWLDHDQAANSYRKATQMMAISGHKVEIVITEKDPKEYDLDIIRKLIQ